VSRGAGSGPPWDRRRPAGINASLTSSVPAAQPVIQIEYEREEDGRWLAEVPRVPGALAYVSSPEEAQVKDRPVSPDSGTKQPARDQSHLLSGQCQPAALRCQLASVRCQLAEVESSPPRSDVNRHSVDVSL
jgi:hypothetical protein